MTIDRNEKVTIPVWLLSGIISIIVAGFAAWGISSGKAAAAEVRLNHVEKAVETKVEQREFNMLLIRLDRIEKKIDELR